MAHSLSSLEQRFVSKLKHFAKNGYAFDADNALREGTQRKAFDAYTKDLSNGERHGYFEIPTGVGKTALFTSLVKNYLDAVNGEDDGPRVLIAVPSEKLAVQTAQSFAKFIPGIVPLIETDDDKGKEIDWENSEIGLQYGKMKHAGRKPRILITTYQSLIRDSENAIYPPSEYGMVIYDEGHALTAEKFGQATDKFKDSLQLAVTATPEYSEEKTVATRLPHRYFQLPLNQAINKDLCNVRPVLLKTNFTVDKAKFARLMEQRHGQPLTDKQMTSLLNQEVRNNSAMETYLLGKDADSGEQYLGQNGMIFCGTTDHADDFTRQFEKLVSQPKYKAVRAWLEEENIELIAPIHGKTEKQNVAGKMQQGAWLRRGLFDNDKITDRPRTGRKQFYTEEEIFKLHDEGKILLLASVAKLKWGYDCPRDKLVIDLVDRLSKVDATQIIGRGFRLDPDDMPDPATNYPGKTCTVINLVDNNTHDLYKDKPHMLPIYCAEIIEGAEFRKPARRPHLLKQFKKKPPELDQALQDSGFRLETDIEAINAISLKNKNAREAAKILKMPAGWASNTQLSQDFIGGAEKFKAMIMQFAADKQIELETQSLAATQAKQQVFTQWAGVYRPGSIETWCISPKGIEELFVSGKLIPRTDDVPLPPTDWISNTGLIKDYVGGGEEFKKIIIAFAAEKEAQIQKELLEKDEVQTILAKEWVGKFKSGVNTAWHISPKALEDLVANGKIKPRLEQAGLAPGGWRSGVDLQDEYVGGNSQQKHVIEVYAVEKRSELTAQLGPELAEKELRDKWVGVYRKPGGKDTWYISPEGVNELLAAAKLKPRTDQLPSAPIGWITVGRLEKDHVGNMAQHTAILKTYAEEKQRELIGQQALSCADAQKEVNEKWVGIYRGRQGIPAWHISPDGLTELSNAKKLVSRMGKIPPPSDWMSGYQLSTKYNGKSTKMNSIIAEFAAEKKAMLTVEGADSDRAGEIVSRQWAGTYLGKAGDALYISPEGVMELEKRKIIIPRIVSLGEDTESLEQLKLKPITKRISPSQQSNVERAEAKNTTRGKV